MRLKVLVLILLLLASLAGCAERIGGKVVGVTDGDTLTLLTPAKQRVRVRLAEIDAPERGQPYGVRAKQALADLAFGRDVRLETVDIDRYGRTVAQVWVGRTRVNAALVEQGAAWVYRKYSRDSHLLELERQARAAGRGLWALPEAERRPPWEWRRAKKSRKN